MMWVATYSAKNSPGMFGVHVEKVDSYFRIKQIISSGISNIVLSVKYYRSILIHSYIVIGQFPVECISALVGWIKTRSVRVRVPPTGTPTPTHTHQPTTTPTHPHSLQM